MTWFDETLHPDIRERLRVSRIIHREKTGHQELVIFENPFFGRVLALDGVIQTTEGDEFIYHEMLVHVPILAHGHVGKALIIGGGDGGALRETLKHRLDRVTVVEIDRGVIELCRRHLPSLSDGAFDDPRTELVIDDGAKFAAETDARFEVIIIDSTDPIGPGEVLFSPDFYANCRRCLNDGGVLVTQNGVPFLQGKELAGSFSRLSRLFADVTFYVAPVPTYNGGHMAFGWATQNRDLRKLAKEVIEERAATIDLKTRYYNPDIHLAAFALPNNIKELIPAP